MKKITCFILSLIISGVLMTACSTEKKESGKLYGQNPSDISSVKAGLNEKKIAELTENYDRQLKSSGFKGICYITENGKVLYKKGIGFADKSKKIKNSEKSVYRIASVTKQFTAAAVLLLQENGKLSLNDKLSKYFPDYKYGNKITIENLLRMRSGIPDYLNMELNKIFPNGYDAYKNSSKMNRKVIEKSIMNMPLNFKPDEKFEYTNSGYMLLGEIIEKVSGTTYYNYLKKEIFDKLGMNSTGFTDDNETKLKNTAKPYNYSEDDEKLIKIKGLTFGCGDMLSNAVDLNKWAEGLRAERILSEKSLNIMTDGTENNSYGCGLYIMSGKEGMYHSGSLAPYYSMLVVSLGKTEYSIILLSNSNFTTIDLLGRDFSELYIGKLRENGI